MEYYSAIKKEQTIDSHRSLDLKGIVLSGKKSFSKDYKLYYFIYMTFLKSQQSPHIKIR